MGWGRKVMEATLLRTGRFTSRAAFSTFPSSKIPPLLVSFAFIPFICFILLILLRYPLLYNIWTSLEMKRWIEYVHMGIFCFENTCYFGYY